MTIESIGPSDKDDLPPPTKREIRIGIFLVILLLAVFVGIAVGARKGDDAPRTSEPFSSSR